ncbi:MAG: peptidylprolyl isomerase [Ramlibacter sp.]|jgi:peptidyl-prolyl cis-trans isomerase C|nr:peptidylprolyl isomerase [Ramlibacter sp.]
MVKLASTSTVTGCGHNACGCAGETAPLPGDEVARINGMALHGPGLRPAPAQLLELAHTELLRQEAVGAGLLPECGGSVAPTLHPDEQLVIERMLDAVVATAVPSDEECKRHFEANKSQYTTGQAVHLRHILFAVTPGVNVHALANRAEVALLELSRKEVPLGRFGQLARQLSNCPSSAQDGDLGWVEPEDCAPELANELFHQTHSQWGMGVHPRLVHTRFGFHIVEVLGRRKGRQLEWEQVREHVRQKLVAQSRARALHQYMTLLAGRARVEGVELDRAESPLVQ